MSDFDVVDHSMSERRFTDAEVEALFGGAPVDGEHAPIAALFASLRERADAVPPVRVTGALSEFVVVADPSDGAPSAARRPRRTAAPPARRSVLAKATALLGVIPTAVLVGASAAAAGAGAQFLGFVDIPFLPGGREVHAPAPSDPVPPSSVVSIEVEPAGEPGSSIAVTGALPTATSAPDRGELPAAGGVDVAEPGAPVAAPTEGLPTGRPGQTDSPGQTDAPGQANANGQANAPGQGNADAPGQTDADAPGQTNANGQANAPGQLNPPGQSGSTDSGAPAGNGPPTSDLPRPQGGTPGAPTTPGNGSQPTLPPTAATPAPNGPPSPDPGNDGDGANSGGGDSSGHVTDDGGQGSNPATGRPATVPTVPQHVHAPGVPTTADEHSDAGRTPED